GDAHDSPGAGQDAVLRAFWYCDSYRDGDARAWLLTIVRNRCLTWQRRERVRRSVIPFAGDGTDAADPREADAPAIERSDRAALERLIGALPTEFPEGIVLRHIQ